MPKKSLLKPSGYDVVIRNRNRLQDLNRRLARLKDPAERGALMAEKDRLIDEMEAACPHEEIAHTDAAKNPFGPASKPMRFCTGCGCSEYKTPSFKVLTCRRGRKLIRLDRAAFAARLGRTLIATGINIKQE